MRKPLFLLMLLSCRYRTNCILQWINVCILFFSALISCAPETERVSKKIQEQIKRIERIANDVEKSDQSKQDSLLVLYHHLKTHKDLQATVPYKQLARAFKKANAPEIYKKVAHTLMHYSLDKKDTFGLAVAHHQLANYYDEKQQYDSLYKYYYNAAKYYLAIDSVRYAGYNYLSMGIAQKNARDYSGAEASSVKALELLESAGEMRYVASAYNNLGLIARQLDKSEQALAYFDTVLEYRKKLSGSQLIQAGTYNNIGIVYINRQDYDQAIIFYNKGLAIEGLHNKRPSTYARLLSNKGYALLKSGMHKNAIDAMLQAYRMRDSIGDILGKSTSAYHLGHYYTAQGDMLEAQHYFQEALAYAEQTNYNTGKLRALQWLAKISPSSQGIVYAQEHLHLNDSLMKVERAFQDQFARVRYETDELKEGKSKAEKQSKWLMVAFLSVTVLFLFGYILKERAANNRKRRFLEEKQVATEQIYGLMLAQQTKIEEGKKIEKERISRELHDGVLSKLFGIRLSLDTLNAGKGDSHIQSRANYLEELKELGQEIRQISHDLQKNQFSTESSYPETVRDLIRKYCEETHMEFTFHNDATIPWEEVTNTKKVNLYRILQEGMINSLRHGKATCIEVTFESQGEDLIMKLVDNGKGLRSKRKPTGIGIGNIKYRVGELGGDFTIKNRKEGGVELEVSFVT